MITISRWFVGLALPAMLSALASLNAGLAMELSVREIGLGIEVWPTSFDYDIDTPVISRSGSDAFSGGGGVKLGGRWSFTRPGSRFGWLATADLATLGMSYDDDDGLAYAGVSLGGGGAYSLARRWSLAADVSVGYGLAELSLPASSAGAGFDGDGQGYSVTGRATIIYNMTRRWSLHAGLGYVASSLDLSAGDTDASLDISGVSYFLGFSWRISDVPTRLE